VLNNADYIVTSGADTRVLWGCVLDLVNALACIGTAVALLPVVKRQNEAVALGFVTSRVLEAAIILIGVVSLLAVVTLRRDLAGAPGRTRPRSSPRAGRWSRSATGPSCLDPGSCPASTHCYWAT
jgi:hypothetical protein